MCVIMITIVFNYFSLYMYLHCYSEFNFSPHCIILVSMYLHCYSEFNFSPHMYYFSLHVSTLL